jgi:hypothetical protein
MVASSDDRARAQRGEMMLPPPARKLPGLHTASAALRLALPTAACLGALALTRPAAAIPSFADQTGLSCQAKPAAIPHRRKAR